MVRLKLQESEKARLKREAERLELVQQITYHGLWQDIGQVERNLATYKKKGEKIKALKTQLKFQKVILEQTPPNKDSTIYNCLVKENHGKRRDLTVDELKQNVTKLVEVALELAKTNPPKEDNPVPLSGKKIRHKFDGDNWYNVIYDGDSSVYTYQLHEDLEAGDLIVEEKNIWLICMVVAFYFNYIFIFDRKFVKNSHIKMDRAVSILIRCTRILQQDTYLLNKRTFG